MSHSIGSEDKTPVRFLKKETEMRKYARNSPQAAARIVALTLVADGDVDKAEFELLDELAVHEQLGLARDALHAVIDTFCEDLLSSKQLAWADNCPVDEYTLSELMREIDEPALRRKVLDVLNPSFWLQPWNTGGFNAMCCVPEARAWPLKPLTQGTDLLSNQ
jgi:hypothetical protein